MNPHAPHSIKPSSLIASIFLHKSLIVQMAKREVIGRYKGSALGMVWSLINPIFMLGLYTFVFSGVFKARWGSSPDETQAQFAIMLFVGLIVHGLFSEILTPAPNLITGNVNFVKKIVFPLHILPIISLGAALFNSLISMTVLLGGYFLFNGYIQWTVLLIPIVISPLLMVALGLAWMLASLGVFMRDIGHSIGIIMTVLLFASPVFYPLSSLPAEMQPWIMLNPLTFIIEQMRYIVIQGEQPDWKDLGLYYLLAMFTCWAGFAWFQKTRKGFANVL